VLALVHAGVVDGERDAVGREPEQVEVVRREVARGGGAHHDDTADLALGEQRHADQGVDVELPQVRERELLGGGVLGEQRLACLRDPSGKALAEGDRLQVEAVRCTARGSSEGEALALVREVDRRGVGVEHAADPGHQVGEDVVERAVGERGVHEQLHPAHHLGHALRLGAGGLLAHQRLAFLLPAPAVGHVADEPGQQDLPAHVHLRHGRLGGEAAAVAALQLDLVVLGGDRIAALHQRHAPLVVAVAELGWRHEGTERLADRLAGGPAEHPLRREVPGADDPVAVERDEGVGRAVEHEARTRLALPQLAPALRRLALLGAQPVEHARDQEARDQRRPHREQPPNRGAHRVLDRKHHRVGHADVADVGEREAEAEEVEGVQRRPRVEQRVERRRAGVVVREAEDGRAGGEDHVKLPFAHPVGLDVDQRGHEDGDGGEDVQLHVLHRLVVGQDERQQTERRPGYEQVGERARLDAEVEQLRQLPHRIGKPTPPVRRHGQTGAPTPRGTRPRGA
jgi:hypothetical protein